MCSVGLGERTASGLPHLHREGDEPACSLAPRRFFLVSAQFTSSFGGRYRSIYPSRALFVFIIIHIHERNYKKEKGQRGENKT